MHGRMLLGFFFFHVIMFRAGDDDDGGGVAGSSLARMPGRENCRWGEVVVWADRDLGARGGALHRRGRAGSHLRNPRGDRQTQISVLFFVAVGRAVLSVHMRVCKPKRQLTGYFGIIPKGLVVVGECVRGETVEGLRERGATAMAVNLTGPSRSEDKGVRQEIEAKTRLQVDRQKLSCARAGPTPSVDLERSVSRRPLSRSNAPRRSFWSSTEPRYTVSSAAMPRSHMYRLAFLAPRA